MKLRTCVHPKGRFVFGVHRPEYRVENLRAEDALRILGRTPDGAAVENRSNFPSGAVEAAGADPVIEIPNPFPFRGTTYILKRWADRRALDPAGIVLPEPPPVSFDQTVDAWAGPLGSDRKARIYESLPGPLKLALATTSTDPEDLVRLAESCCEFVIEPGTSRRGLRFSAGDPDPRPVIHDPALFDAVANNPNLPDEYKEAMVLTPGVQGGSEIVGDWRGTGDGSHVFEYLRRNSYIPWGHYAANMAHDAVRYRAGALSEADMRGMRHLYYQRTYVRLAAQIGIAAGVEGRPLTGGALESLRQRILAALGGRKKRALDFNASLWGWNFGFDYAPSRYRLHASHQQIHQQFAMVPARVAAPDGAGLSAYGCGDMVADFVRAYRKETGASFFERYLRAIDTNQRIDETDGPRSLVVWEDDSVTLFVPKAQTSQWELQLMPRSPAGNVLEADKAVRASIDRGIRTALQTLEAMGARMITCLEYGKRFDDPDTDPRLLYVFLPRLPESPGAFSEAQLRWINGHYPEDFAAACRMRIKTAEGGGGPDRRGP